MVAQIEREKSIGLNRRLNRIVRDIQGEIKWHLNLLCLGLGLFNALQA